MRTKAQRKARRIARRQAKRQAAKVGASSGGAPRTKNPQKKGSMIPWLVGLAGAGVAAYGAYRAFNPAVPAPPPGQPAPGMHGGYPPPNYQDRFVQQRAYYEQAGQLQPGMAGGVDEHGIPTIALPPESAARTLQAMRYQQAAEAQGLLPVSQQAAARAAAAGQAAHPGANGNGLPQGIPIESFGGVDGGTLGGEGF